MKIPVFVSCPTRLTTDQMISRKLVLDELERYQLEPRALGRSDYPTELPLRLEAGVLFGLRIPLLVFREPDVTGGVFDNGVTDAFIHRMPTDTMDDEGRAGFVQVFLKWQASVREHYYR